MSTKKKKKNHRKLINIYDIIYNYLKDNFGSLYLLFLPQQEKLASKKPTNVH